MAVVTMDQHQLSVMFCLFVVDSRFKRGRFINHIVVKDSY